MKKGGLRGVGKRVDQFLSFSFAIPLLADNSVKCSIFASMKNAELLKKYRKLQLSSAKFSVHC
jgi:hypothetical protein